MTQEKWNNFVASNPHGSFLQSWQWGAMQGILQVPHWRLTEEGDTGVTGAALVIQRQVPWGKSWLYIPKGPLWENSNSKTQNPKLMQQIIALGEQEKAMFIRIEPAEVPVGEGWRKATNDVQPRHTIVLDLTKTEEELLADMHQKTRYNIRLAGKHKVQVRFSTEASDLEHFLHVSHDVKERSAFHYHPASYYRAMQQALASPAAKAPGDKPTRMLEIAIAEHGGDILAVHLLISFGNTVTYAHGASSSAKRELMAPHLLQWESIRRAKSEGYKNYDFFGVMPPDAGPNHSWAGITRFKEGFGGRRLVYVGAYDYILDHTWYWAYSTSRRARSLWR